MRAMDQVPSAALELTEGPLLSAWRGRALWLTFNRPESLNPLGASTVETLAGLIDALEAGKARPAALVLTGAGRAFSAGGDLAGMRAADGSFDSGAPLFTAISRVLSRLESLELPVIAAVNGLCIAGGLEVALACDLVIAAEGARFGDGHANFGLLPGGGGSVRLARAIGPARAKYMMFTGDLFSARQMEGWGLVTRLVPDGGLVEAVDALVETLARKSPLGLARMKRLVDGGLALSVEAALAEELRVCEAHDVSYDRNEGLKAFAEKRMPVFEGR